MRLAGKVKFGYYPAPATVVDLIGSYLQPAKQGVMALLDPCAGEGLAIAQLQRILGHESIVHLIEKDGPRADLCRAKGFGIAPHQVFEQDSTSNITYGRKQYSLVWFNPPYDWNAVRYGANKDDKRDSEVFFRNIINHARPIAPDGIFVGILPVTDIRYLAKAFMAFFAGPEDDVPGKRSYPLLFSFPDPEYESFGQYVVIGRQRARLIASNLITEQEVLAWSAGAEDDTAPVLTRATEPLFTLPARPKAEDYQLMETTIYNPVEGFESIKRMGWGTRPGITDDFWPPDDVTTNPVLPLSDAHLAMLVASGSWQEGKVFDASKEGLGKYMFKGRTRRVLGTVSEEVNAAKRVKIRKSREEFVTELVSLTPDGDFTLYVMDKLPEEDKED